jgi:hypothetical protein
LGEAAHRTGGAVRLTCKRIFNGVSRARWDEEAWEWSSSLLKSFT